MLRNVNVRVMQETIELAIQECTDWKANVAKFTFPFTDYVTLRHSSSSPPARISEILPTFPALTGPITCSTFAHKTAIRWFLYMELTGMRPNNAFQLSTLKVQWQIYITSSGLLIT